MKEKQLNVVPVNPDGNRWEVPEPYLGLFDPYHTRLFQVLCDALCASRGVGKLIAGDRDHVAQTVAAAQSAAKWQQVLTGLLALEPDLRNHHERGAVNVASTNQRACTRAYHAGLHSLGLEASVVGRQRAKAVANASRDDDPKSKWRDAGLA